MKTATAVIVLCTVVIVYLFFTVSHYISTIIDSKRPLMKITQTRKLYNYLQEMDKLNIERVQMDDPRLIHLIRNYWIENPSEEPYNLKSPDEMDPSIGQAAFVDNRLNFQVEVLLQDEFIINLNIFYLHKTKWIGQSKSYLFCPILNPIYEYVKMRLFMRKLQVPFFLQPMSSIVIILNRKYQISYFLFKHKYSLGVLTLKKLSI